MVTAPEYGEPYDDGGYAGDEDDYRAELEREAGI